MSSCYANAIVLLLLPHRQGNDQGGRSGSVCPSPPVSGILQLGSQIFGVHFVPQFSLFFLFCPPAHKPKNIDAKEIIILQTVKPSHSPSCFSLKFSSSRLISSLPTVYVGVIINSRLSLEASEMRRKPRDRSRRHISISPTLRRNRIEFHWALLLSEKRPKFPNSYRGNKYNWIGWFRTDIILIQNPAPHRIRQRLGWNKIMWTLKIGFLVRYLIIRYEIVTENVYVEI